MNVPFTAEMLSDVIDSGTRYKPLTPTLEVLFTEENHTYEFNGWHPPSTSKILKEQGINLFDPTYWRHSLMKKGCKENGWIAMTFDEAEAWMEEVRVAAAKFGTDFHTWIDGALKHNNMAGFDEQPIRSHFPAIVNQLGITDVLLCESVLVNPVGMYCGTVDCLAMTKHGPTVIDWKTTSEIRKAGRKDWQRYQLAAYMGAINREYPVKVRHGANVYIAPDGFRVIEWTPDQMREAWSLFKGHLRDFWFDRCERGCNYHSPEMAEYALEQIESVWGPFH